MRYHFIREHVEAGIVELVFIPTNQQVEDIFTKPLCEATFTRLVNELTIKLATLDGRDLRIPIKDMVKPGHEEVIPDEGMPISKEPRKRGNLRIKFDLKFPSRLSSDQKSDLRRVLGSSY
ncbi:hypothetical protein AgCh_006080 [Apium graveolens]